MPLTYPGNLVTPNTATAIETSQLKDKHAERKRVWLECKNVEKVLLHHRQDALEDKYAEALVDEYANLFSDDIPAVLQCLFYNYSKVSSEEVTQKEQEVINTTWLPSDPLVLLIRLLEQLES